MLNYSQRDKVAADLAALKTARAGREQALASANLEQIQADPALLQFAMAEGKAAFGDNCAPCHGSGAAVSVVMWAGRRNTRPSRVEKKSADGVGSSGEPSAHSA